MGFPYCRAQALGCTGFRSFHSWAREHSLNSCGTRAYCRTYCSAVCGIFPDQGWNLCLLHWQADFLLLSQQGSPINLILVTFMEHHQLQTHYSQVRMNHLPRKTMCIFVVNCFSCNWLFVTSWTEASQALLSTGFSRQEYWSGLPCPPPGESSQSRDRTHWLSLLHWQAGSLLLAPAGKPQVDYNLGHKTNLNKYSLAMCYKTKPSLNHTIWHSCSLVFIQMSWKLMST